MGSGGVYIDIILFFPYKVCATQFFCNTMITPHEPMLDKRTLTILTINYYCHYRDILTLLSLTLNKLHVLTRTVL